MESVGIVHYYKNLFIFFYKGNDSNFISINYIYLAAKQ